MLTWTIRSCERSPASYSTFHNGDSAARVHSARREETLNGLRSRKERILDNSTLSSFHSGNSAAVVQSIRQSGLMKDQGNRKDRIGNQTIREPLGLRFTACGLASL